MSERQRASIEYVMTMLPYRFFPQRGHWHDSS